MADRAKKVTELATLSAPSADDLMIIVDSPASAAVTKKITVGNLATYFTAASANVNALPTLSSTSTDDYLTVLDDPSGTPVLKKISVGNMLGGYANLSANAIFSNSSVVSANTLIVRHEVTPPSSSASVAKGTIFFDANYLYIAVANNTIKRLPLESF